MKTSLQHHNSLSTMGMDMISFLNNINFLPLLLKFLPLISFLNNIKLLPLLLKLFQLISFLNNIKLLPLLFILHNDLESGPGLLAAIVGYTNRGAVKKNPLALVVRLDTRNVNTQKSKFLIRCKFFLRPVFCQDAYKSV
jgi:hypothetical protein